MNEILSKKQLIKELVLERKYESLVKLAEKKHSQTLKYIQMNLFEDINSPLRWHAIEALGRLARELAPKELEIYRNLLRRFLWAMNDESGNVPWSSPEAMGSIIVNQPFLLGEYTPMLITNALDNPMCHRGMLWAAWQIAKTRNSLVLPFVKEIAPFIKSTDPDLRGYCALALGELGYHEVLPQLVSLQEDESPVLIFRKGKLIMETVGSLALEAINQLEKAS